jgi:hypothetical protein
LDQILVAFDSSPKPPRRLSFTHNPTSELPRRFLTGLKQTQPYLPFQQESRAGIGASTPTTVPDARDVGDAVFYSPSAYRCRFASSHLHDSTGYGRSRDECCKA